MKTAADAERRRAWRGAAPHVARLFAAAALLTAAAPLAGCGASAPVVVTAQHVQAYGTATFEEDPEAPDTVFRACVLALQMAGHRIEVAERSAGLVVTEPDGRLLPGSRPRHGYRVEVRSSPDGRVTVSATPEAPDELRDLDHERALWERLFADVRDLVGRWRAESP